MKKALNFLLMFIILLFTGIILGTFLYSLHLNVINFIAGKDLNLFNKEDLIISFFYFCQCFAFFICPLMAYYRIRHAEGISQTIVYLIIVIFMWGLFFPGIIKFKNIVFEKYSITPKTTTLSGGYFRKVDDKIYYLVRDLNTDYGYGVPVVVIDTTEDGIVTMENVKSTDKDKLNVKSSAYSDVLIRNSFSGDKLNRFISISGLTELGEIALGKGLTFYLGFLSISLALAALYAITSLFNWKLINVCSIVLSTVVIIWVNLAYYMPNAAKFRDVINAKGFWNYFQPYVEAPFTVFVNIIYSILLIGLGIFMFFKHKSDAKKKSQGE